MLMALAGGMLLGVIAARYRNRWPDQSIGVLTLLGYSIPTFWWAFLLVLLFSLTLMWLPASGRLSFLYDIQSQSGFLLIDTLISPQPYASEAFFNALSHLFLPAIVLSFLPIAVIARVTRAALIESLQSDYIRMARGQGIPESRLLWVYALRNATVPLLNVLALQLSVFVTCQMLVESIFAWPGVGKWLLDAVQRGDHRAVQFGVLTLCSIIVFINVVMDILQSRLNPQRWRKRK
jgi:dipeptide transport system permease protein